MWPKPARWNSGSSRLRTSSTATYDRLSTQAPSTLPTATSGASASVTELMPVASSGSEVTVVSSTNPTQAPDQPVLSAITSA